MGKDKHVRLLSTIIRLQASAWFYMPQSYAIAHFIKKILFWVHHALAFLENLMVERRS